jgi:hypothetical protein
VTLEAYHATAVFGPHRWMISGSDDSVIGQAQFTSKHDAETAISVAYRIACEAERELGRKISELLP